MWLEDAKKRCEDVRKYDWSQDSAKRLVDTDLPKALEIIERAEKIFKRLPIIATFDCEVKQWLEEVNR